MMSCWASVSLTLRLLGFLALKEEVDSWRPIDHRQCIFLVLATVTILSSLGVSTSPYEQGSTHCDCTALEDLCNKLPAFRRVDGVCVCVRMKTRHNDGTRSFSIYFERSLPRSCSYSWREEERGKL